MTKRDFELIARVLNEARGGDYTSTEVPLVLDALNRSMAYALRETNPRFDVVRFLKASGYPHEIHSR